MPPSFTTTTESTSRHALPRRYQISPAYNSTAGFDTRKRNSHHDQARLCRRLLRRYNLEARCRTPPLSINGPRHKSRQQHIYSHSPISKLTVCHSSQTRTPSYARPASPCAEVATAPTRSRCCSSSWIGSLGTM